VGVEITGPDDRTAVVCNLCNDRPKLTPERLQIEREFASKIHPMCIGYKQFIAAGNPIGRSDAALWSANDRFAIARHNNFLIALLWRLHRSHSRRRRRGSRSRAQ
jgi:hypothetical protein